MVDIASGEEIATAVYGYPSGEAGILLDPSDLNLARQNPADYIEGFFQAVGGAVRVANAMSGFDAKNVVGIGVDTTGSTPIPVDKNGTALAMLDNFRNEFAAQAWLWKDHTSHVEEDEITRQDDSQSTLLPIDFCYSMSSQGLLEAVKISGKRIRTDCYRTVPLVHKGPFTDWLLVFLEN